MTEKPILFSGPMVRAILENRKTQTRRIVKPQPDYLNNPDKGLGRSAFEDGTPMLGDADAAPIRCPYPVGTRLWVKETFMHEPAEYDLSLSGTHPFRKACTIYRADISNGGEKGAGWKPSIFMPRRLSRITLEVTKVRVERLQEISEADAVAEGIEHAEFDGMFGWKDYETGFPLHRAIESFASLWRSINGPDSWNDDTFVRVYDFREVEA